MPTKEQIKEAMADLEKLEEIDEIIETYRTINPEHYSIFNIRILTYPGFEYNVEKEIMKPILEKVMNDKRNALIRKLTRAGVEGLK